MLIVKQQIFLEHTGHLFNAVDKKIYIVTRNNQPCVLVYGNGIFVIFNREILLQKKHFSKNRNEIQELEEIITLCTQ